MPTLSEQVSSAVAVLELSADKAKAIVETDAVIETETGNIKTLPKVIREAEAEFKDRLQKMAFIRVGTFTDGFTLTDARQVLIWELSQGGNGKEYSWNGELPRYVSPLTAPNAVGWIDRSGDIALEELNVHSRSSNAHPELYQFITAEANRAEAARDAALLQSGVYSDEATGRAAVADGAYFKVQGGGDVATYEYRRTNSSTSVLVATYPSINAITAIINAIYYINRITGKNFIVSPNLFDKSDSGFTTGYFVNHFTGALASNASYMSSGYVPVSAATTYYIYPKSYLAWYDKNKTYISGVSSSDTNNAQTSPANAAYLRFTIPVTAGAAQDTAYVVLGSSALSAYSDFGAYLDGSRVIGLTYANMSDELASAVFYLKRVISGGLIETKNIFNKNDADFTDNYLVNNSSGVLQANTGYSATGFIPVTPSTAYYLSYKSFISWYDKNKKYISGSSNSDTNNAQTSPSNARYLRCSILKSSATKDNFYVVKGSSALSKYEDYGSTLATSRLSGVDSAQIKNKAVTADKTDFLISSKNLFNKNAITPNVFAGADGVQISSSTYSLSDFIEVTPGASYFCSSNTLNARFLTAYDSDKNVVSASGLNAASSLITVPTTGVKYYRFTLYNSEIDSYQFELGTSRSTYSTYHYTFDSKVISPSSAGWVDKIAYSFGDSITAQNKWQPLAASALGLAHSNFGVGGRRVSGKTGMCQDSAINLIPSDANLVMVLGGTNDWAQSVVLGNTESTNSEEFYGAYNQMCQKLTTRFPSSTIVLLTTPYGELPNRLSDGSNWSNAYTNNVGLTTREYAEAVRVMGKRWGFPVIDLSDCGWNSINVSAFTEADGGHIHPNTDGAKRIARVCIGRLLDLQPLS